jgi:hypothetical protein
VKGRWRKVEGCGEPEGQGGVELVGRRPGGRTRGSARTESIDVSDDKGVKVVIQVIYFAST